MTASVIVIKSAKTERYTIWGIYNSVYWTNTLTTLARTLENRHYYRHFTNHRTGSEKKIVQGCIAGKIWSSDLLCG